jgi:hypothetical protein
MNFGCNKNAGTISPSGFGGTVLPRRPNQNGQSRSFALPLKLERAIFCFSKFAK